ncbi:MAG: DNA alkylation repair protein [Bdellovibrionales bacterium]|jgi:3-methyladenine DNA glycosylase AlkD|nr:DNA alkylation repair protein [Bdellovibrionales bacterium]
MNSENPPQTALHAQKVLRAHGNAKKIKILQRFFKTQKGEYGEGDQFLGVMVPETRRVALTFKNLPLPEVKKLLYSVAHEDRLLALVVLVNQYKIGTQREQNEIFNFYLRHKRQVNNWDLVDVSSHHIVGAHLIDKPREPLYKLAHSKSLWDSRIAIVSTYFFIRQNDFKDTLNISKILLRHPEDLIHKAVGWMLREVGKRDTAILCQYLNKHGPQMPRTMLRYAIERLSQEKRLYYLKRK